MAITELRARSMVWLGAAVLLGCGASSSSGGGEKAGMGGAPPTCGSDAECQDGVFCNGVEQCLEGSCEPGELPACDDGIRCTVDVCSHLENGCLFRAPDQDGDGHADASCFGPNDDALGDDCDDEDASRYPGNMEVCSTIDPTHDEDCDPDTFGRRDADADGEVSAECCNEDDEGEMRCGLDCDDHDPSRYSEHPEICDDVDNDCNGEVDTNTREVEWYPDEDGDQYGALDSDGILSCAPVSGHSLRSTDCDDSLASVHPAATEMCNGVDDDCDGEVDEDGVCLCSPEGESRPCACAPQVSGSQTCVEGSWSACDCSECVSGVSECLGDLLPRTCVAGRWVVESACQGLRPICLAGQCICADGSESCEEIDDIVPPVIVDSSPSHSQLDISRGATLAVVFSEPVASASFAADSVRLRDSRGSVVPGLLALGGTILSFTPAEPLAPGMDYTLSVDAAVADLSGNVLGPNDPIQFTTELDLVLLPFGDAPHGYSGVELAVSPLGRREVLAFQNALAGDILIANQVRFIWDGGDWIEASSPFFGSTGYSPALDDAGVSYALSHVGTDLSRRQTTDGTWDAAIGFTGSDAPPALLQANSAGHAAIAYKGSDVQMTYRDSGGTWVSFAVSEGDGGMEFFEMSLNESGAVGVVFSKFLNDTLGVTLSMPDFTGFVSHSRDAVANERVLGADIAMAESGEATVVWMEEEFFAESDVNSRIQARDVSTSGWIGTTATLSSLRGVSLPRVVIDGAGARHATYLIEGDGLYATRRASGSTDWTTPRRLNALDSGAVAYELHVAASGEVLVVWTQGDAHVDLFASKYAPGGGWSPPRRLEGKTTDIESFSAGMDAEGNAAVVFASGGRLESLEL